MRTTLLLAFTYQGGSWGSHLVSAILIAYYGTSTYTPTATHSWYRTKIGWRLPVSGCSTVGREPPAGLRILELEAEYPSGIKHGNQADKLKHEKGNQESVLIQRQAYAIGSRATRIASTRIAFCPLRHRQLSALKPLVAQ
jgi:hypothetical protein